MSDEQKDWDDMNLEEKLSAVGIDGTGTSPDRIEAALDAFAETLDTINQIEDLVKYNDPPIVEAKLRKMILALCSDEGA